MNIPSDIRQFRLTHLFWVVTSFAVALTCRTLFMLGNALPILVGCFWFGMLFFMLSDYLDPRPIDDRGWLPLTINVLGMFIVLSAVVLSAICIGLNLLVRLSMIM